MFTREEASRVKHEFWSTFGRYMEPVLSSEGIRINWVNYHTKIKNVYFRMDAGVKSATIYISLEHADPGIRELYFAQLIHFKDILHAELGEVWEWELNVTVDGKVVSKIYKILPGVSVMDKGQWPDLISFLKPRIIALDAFWENARYSFEALQ